MPIDAPVIILDGSDQENHPEEEEAEAEVEIEEPSEWGRESETPEESTISDAINSATKRRLQTVLSELYTESPDAARRISKKLLYPFDRGTKRRRVYEICRNCKEEYDALNNDDGDCVYHPSTHITNP